MIHIYFSLSTFMKCQYSNGRPVSFHTMVLAIGIKVGAFLLIGYGVHVGT